MRYDLPRRAAIAAGCTLAIAILPINAADESAKSQELTVRVYPVADLPVYVAPRGVEATFNPVLLTGLLEARVGAEDWQGDRDSIAPHETTNSLVIRTTRANHQRISTILEVLRRDLRPDDAPDEAAAEIGLGDDLQPLRLQEKQEVSATEAYDRLSASVLNTISRSEPMRFTDRKLAESVLNKAFQKVDKSPLDGQQKGILQERLLHQLGRVQSTPAARNEIGSTTSKMQNSADVIAIQYRLQEYDAVKQRRIADARLGIPADLQILGDALTHPTASNGWTSWKEHGYPDDRDFNLGGYPFTH